MILATTIQCRDYSTRIKLKSVRPFYKGMSILEIIIRRLKMVYRKRNLFVLTTANSVKTQEQADDMGVKVFIGNEEDVYDRFFKFVIRYQPEGVIRICADNPLFSMALMFPIEKWGRSGLYDYVSFKDAMLREEGLFCEYISEAALTGMKNKPMTDYDREHVTPYIYNHPDEYRLKILPIPPIMDEIHMRLTVDTKVDFKIAQKIYNSVGENYWGNIYNMEVKF
ncbi:hypothetical protein LCGC14_1279320 [marine sediment metagenome]|uniref:Acylneuraminate cytidylyltransferase n=1 Tax=marine sediment metagenome TaxID=412755 RepID=A0A0F9NCE8_9ZZZZ